MGNRRGLALVKPSGHFSAPVEAADGTTVLPVSDARGRAIGVFVVADGRATWEPVVDASWIPLLVGSIGLAAVLAAVAMVRRPPWPDLHVTV
ncbi:hypothetical protein GCM10029964_037160 [Kibdelosporangium lantanae]